MKTAYCFDLDGTVTQTEILPVIAAELGMTDEIEVLTRATMDGLIPFDASFRLRCLVLGLVPPETIATVVASIPLHSDILEFIQSRQADCFLVTGNLDIWVAPIVQRCGCGAYTSTAVNKDGRLCVDHILNKAHVVEKLREQKGYERIVAVGDGANDVGMLDMADIGIAYGGVHPPAGPALTVSDLVINDGTTLCKLLKTL
jgi:HAD superfamily phosphoserine phosphatase-like hydrolase